MIRKILFLFTIVPAVLPVQSIFGQKQYAKNQDVIYELTADKNQYTINYTFRDHYNNFQNFTLKLPIDLTENEIAAFGVPQWLFDPYVDNFYNRTIRNNELSTGMFVMEDNAIKVDKGAVIARYAETFCKPISGLIIQSLEDYKRDTRRDRIEMAIRFVQDIPYGIPDYENNDRYYGGVSPPPEVLRNGYGDCDSKVLLFAGILIYLIPADEFVFINQPEHVLSAIKDKVDDGLTYISYKGEEFLLAETAGPGQRLLGEKGQYYKESFTVEPLHVVSPEVFPYKTPVSSRPVNVPEKCLADNLLVIQNSSDHVLRFQLSPDNTHWKEFTLNENNLGNYNFKSETSVFLKIREKNPKAKIYKIRTGNAYRFSYNTKENFWEAY